MNKKYINIDLDDERIKDLADVISNKTSKKIIDYLADNEASEAQITKDLELAANTVNYNIKKLLQSGLIEKSKKWNWSVKGKKIPYYHVANKKIVISPRSFNYSKKILSTLVITGLMALGIKNYTEQQFIITEITDNFDKVASAESITPGGEIARDFVVPQLSQMPEVWIWFLLGGIVALIIFMILNWRKL